MRQTFARERLLPLSVDATALACAARSGVCSRARPVLPDLRWLHFTDLHVGQKELEQGYWSATKQALLADLRRTTSELGPWDVVVFTGDPLIAGRSRS